MKKAIIIITLLFINIMWSAYDSHQDPQRYEESVRYGMTFNWE